MKTTNSDQLDVHLLPLAAERLRDLAHAGPVHLAESYAADLSSALEREANFHSNNGWNHPGATALADHILAVTAAPAEPDGPDRFLSPRPVRLAARRVAQLVHDDRLILPTEIALALADLLTDEHAEHAKRGWHHEELDAFAAALVAREQAAAVVA